MVSGNTTSQSRFQARQALENSSIRELRLLEVEESDGQIVISGRVGSFYHKQLAQELVRSAIKDCDLTNTVCVD